METTEALMQRAQGGDHRAFAELVSLHDGRLRVLAQRLLEDPHRVDDALQEAYLRAYRNLGKFRGDSSVGTWLYRITSNVCLDELRKRPVVVAWGEDSDVPCSQSGPAERAVAAVEAARMLDRLDPEVRKTVVLVHGLGYDYVGASSVLGVPEGTVASRLNRVRSRMRATPARPARPLVGVAADVA